VKSRVLYPRVLSYNNTNLGRRLNLMNGYPSNMFVYRKKAGVTQHELGRLVGVSQPRICNIETGTEDRPPMRLLEAIAKVISYPQAPETLQHGFGSSVAA
jgi:DNA-binding XRE family transcriptional regulator